MPVSARCEPPFRLCFLRRNQVLVAVCRGSERRPHHPRQGARVADRAPGNDERPLGQPG